MPASLMTLVQRSSSASWNCWKAAGDLLVATSEPNCQARARKAGVSAAASTALCSLSTMGLLAGSAARDAQWIRRLRTLTVGFLTPFYFLRAGTLVSLPALLAAPLVFVMLLGGKVLAKIFGLYPVIALFRRERNERCNYTLMMSTGLTFGTISSLFGLSHGIVTQEQYSFLVAAVIASAVVPTVIAGAVFFPRHLLPEPDRPLRAMPRVNGLSDEG